jgi:hypothetical protein
MKTRCPHCGSNEFRMLSETYGIVNLICVCCDSVTPIDMQRSKVTNALSTDRMGPRHHPEPRGEPFLHIRPLVSDF